MKYLFFSAAAHGFFFVPVLLQTLDKCHYIKAGVTIWCNKEKDLWAQDQYKGIM